MLLTLSLFGLQKAPLNTTIEFLGFDSMMGIARAYVLLMYLANICVLQLICKLSASGQTEFRDVVYGGIAVQFSGVILAATTEKLLGIFSIVPVFVVTVLLLVKVSGLSPRSASWAAGIYYTYHLVSLVLLRLIADKVR
jgi:hypothetical protein